MHRRCYDRRNNRYYAYGGRGIRVCARWRDFGNFLEDMGRKPSPEHSIDRKDNDGDYEPNNCRWATATEQARNKRTCRKITHAGETLTLHEWSARTGISYGLLYGRLVVRRMRAELALTMPVNERKRGRAKDYVQPA